MSANGRTDKEIQRLKDKVEALQLVILSIYKPQIQKQQEKLERIKISIENLPAWDDKEHPDFGFDIDALVS
jgi:hypothetical protein